MTDMLHIARSGVLASRAALAVTAENVANVGTEGYRRRDVASVAAAGGQTTPQTLPTGGQGVSVTEVRRAFDHLVAERGRMAASAHASAAAHQGVAEAVEARLIPGDSGLDGSMRAFFDSLSRLAASPADMTTRAQTLRSAEALAAHMAETAAGLQQLRADTLAQAGQSAAAAQGLLEDLHGLNAQIARSGAGAGHHPLADRRDALLTELSRQLPVAVSLTADGRPEIRLGSEAGPLLLDSSGAARLSVSGRDQLTLHITAPDGSARETRMIGAGRIGGLAMGLGAIDMARQEFDQLARNMVEGMNQLHRSGVDLAGRGGQDLFSLQGWAVTPAAANAGRVQVQVHHDGIGAPPGPVELVFHAAAAEWQARDEGGTLLASGRERLNLPGVAIDLAGAARDGDRITLTPVTGRAQDLRLALSDPRALAASADMVAAPATGNAGAARLQVSRPAETPRPEALDLLVTDAETGQVELRSVPDGALVEAGVLDAQGRVGLAGLDLHLTGAALSGDRFALRPTAPGSGNGDLAQSMAAMRRGEGTGSGLHDQLARFQGDLGTRAAAAARAQETAQARLESAEREEAALGAVNLDVEAARMVELQQSYQASAQALSIARSLFETLLRMM